jgi:GNAT superfamily N-acetyltransferase
MGIRMPPRRLLIYNGTSCIRSVISACNRSIDQLDNMYQIKIASQRDIEKILPVLVELRPHRTDEEIRRLFVLLWEEGYRIAFIGEDLARSILGFRIVTTFFSGKTLVVDDLCTSRGFEGRGYGHHLFLWIKEYAKEMHCEHICLNSGFQRKDAHRFYLNHGMKFESMHFGSKISEL